MAKRTAAQQKAYNAEKQRAFRAKQKAKNNPTSSSMGDTSNGVVSNGDSIAPLEDALEVDVIEEAQPVEEKLSLFQRTMNKIGLSQNEAPVKRTGRGRKQKENLLITALPTVLASLVVTYATQMLPEEYEACAPKQEEVTGIIAPLMDIIGRRIEIVGKVNQDATDVISSILCALMMGVRMYVTYVEIRNEGNPHAKAKPTREESYKRSLEREAELYADDSGSGQDDSIISLAQGMRNHQAARQGIVADGDRTARGAINAHDSENDANGGNAHSNDGTGYDADSEASKVASLFRRDIAGRQQLGLLPRAV